MQRWSDSPRVNVGVMIAALTAGSTAKWAADLALASYGWPKFSWPWFVVGPLAAGAVAGLVCFLGLRLYEKFRMLPPG